DECGRCAPPLPAGGACAVESQCAYPLRCVANVCVALVEQNAACKPDGDLCEYGLGCQTNVCVAASAGAPCSSVAQDCQTNFYCSGATSTCLRDAFAQPGATCGWVN